MSDVDWLSERWMDWEVNTLRLGLRNNEGRNQFKDWSRLVYLFFDWLIDWLAYWQIEMWNVNGMWKKGGLI